MGEPEAARARLVIRYYRNGQRFEESSPARRRALPSTCLKIREGDGAHGLPVTPKMGRLRFEEAVPWSDAPRLAVYGRAKLGARGTSQSGWRSS